MRMHKIVRPAVIAAAAVTLVAGACSNSSSSSSGTSSGGSTGGFQGAPLNGAGSTFAQPLYQLWSQSFLQKEPDAQINYQAIGSGGGIEQFTAQTVDFGATDVPLQSDEIGEPAEPELHRVPHRARGRGLRLQRCRASTAA